MALCFTNELAYRAELSRIPQALHDRFGSHIEELATNLGIRAIASNSNTIEVDISGASPANFFRFVDEAHICAVSIGPQDVVALMGRNLDSLVLKRAVERGQVKFEKLLPEEIMPTLRETAWGLVGTEAEGEETTGVFKEIAEDDLLKAGYVTKRDLEILENPFQSESRYSGFHGGGRDLGALPSEFTESPADEIDPFLN